MKRYLFAAVTISFIFASCSDKPKTLNQNTAYHEGSFGHDLQFLQQYDSVIVLRSDEAAQVIVSPKYQGKVFTSTAEGLPGKSFGWINYKAFKAPLDSHMNAYGGENRLWIGPEGGPFSVFFPKGKEMTFANWKTPAPIDTEPWSVKSRNDGTVQMQKTTTLTNYAGTVFNLTVDRTIAILNRKAIEDLVQLPLDTSIKMVGYRTNNTITNKGINEWNERSGAPCIWMLDMFNPSAETTIVIPYEEAGSSNQKVATTDYFGEIAPERIKIRNGVLFFKADGKSRGKLGLSPLRAKPVAGSYDASANVLTLAFFDVEKTGKYLNQEWTTKKPPFSGDAVNAYNDGPLQDGKQMGPFYEIESVSPAAFLQPGASLTHRHSVLHFTGSPASLDRLSQKILHVSLADIQAALK
jgi:hypothetical protein